VYNLFLIFETDTTATEATGFDPTMLMLPILGAALIFFMWRSNKRRKDQQEQLTSSLVPGVEVMTTFGLFGTLLSVDSETNVAELEVAPGNVLRVHSQAIGRVITPESFEASESDSDDTAEDNK